jgi:glyoxylate/hydroxypyruvate reductase A
MAILFLTPSANSAARWADGLREEFADEDIRINQGPEGDEDVEFAIVWKPPPGRLRALPNLKVIFSIGAGVDHVFADPDLPKDVPIVRLIDETLTTQMTEYVVMNVLWHHREMDDYAALAAEKTWRHLHPPRTPDRRVGIMGLGVLGSAAGEALSRFGFSLAAWTRGPRDWPLGEAYSGADGLAPFLSRTDILVCLLPLTPETTGILNAENFAALPRGAMLINAARGGHLIEADLLEALEDGQIKSATLDVFEEEPLAPDHPFWSHPKVRVTPHVASLTYPDAAAQEIARNIARFRAGEPMIGVVDTAREY